MENESQSTELGGAGFDALFDYDDYELLEEGSSESSVPAESPSDAGSVDQEDESSSGTDGERGGTVEEGAEAASRTEESESSSGGGSGGEESAEEESSGEETSEGESSEGETSGGETSGGETSGGETSGDESSGGEPVSGTQEAAFWESVGEYAESVTGETLIPDGDLGQIHSDLQFISCFLVLFLVIILCHYAYRFLKIFI